MSSPFSFRGVATALVTPMQTNGDVDTESLKYLVEFQITNGVQGLVPCGTTGESATLSHPSRQTEEYRSSSVQEAIPHAKRSR
jgi:dihydrodipicolinate synthase/N-acetylneuraminate lyase